MAHCGDYRVYPRSSRPATAFPTRCGDCKRCLDAHARVRPVCHGRTVNVMGDAILASLCAEHALSHKARSAVCCSGDFTGCNSPAYKLNLNTRTATLTQTKSCPCAMNAFARSNMLCPLILFTSQYNSHNNYYLYMPSDPLNAALFVVALVFFTFFTRVNFFYGQKFSQFSRASLFHGHFLSQPRPTAPRTPHPNR